jgi:hypoxanthine phosphoribosyltransferase
LNTLTYTWKNLEEDVDILEKKIKNSKLKIDWIIGLSRGGLIPSVCLSHRLNAKHGVYTISSYNEKEKKSIKKDLYISMIGQIKATDNVLIVDDLVDCGDSMKETIKALKKIDSDIKNVYTCVLYYKHKSTFKPDFFAKEMDEDRWINFTWERYHNEK